MDDAAFQLAGGGVLIRSETMADPTAPGLGEAERPRAVPEGHESLQVLLRRGAQLTEEILRDNEELRRSLRRLETENTKLKAQLASDDAIRDLLRSIRRLEEEKDALLSRWDQAEATTSRFSARYGEVEAELASMANLYVASYHLHDSLRVPVVLRRLQELLSQLLGAQSLAFYVEEVSDGARRLVPIFAHGVDLASLPAARVGASELPAAASLIERVFLTDLPHVHEGPTEGCGPAAPAACIPLHLESHVIGCIVIYALLPQKAGFIAADHSLLQLLGAHAGTALVAAQLYADAGERTPALTALRAEPRSTDLEADR